MAELTIVAGECGRGSGEYDTGLFTLQAGGDRERRGGEDKACELCRGDFHDPGL